VGLKPDTSLTLGIASATLAYATFQAMTPNVADIRATESGNRDIQASERLATWVAGLTVAGISLLAKDANIFIIGGSAVIALSWSRKHADMVDTVTKRATPVIPKISDVGTTPSGVTEAPAMSQVTMNYGASVF
jgi:hypothetical protein